MFIPVADVLEKIQSLHKIEGLVRLEITLLEYLKREAEDIIDIDNPVFQEIYVFMNNHFSEILTGLLQAQQIAVPLFVKNANSLKIAGILIGIESEIIAGVQAANAANTTKTNNQSEPAHPTAG